MILPKDRLRENPGQPWCKCECHRIAGIKHATACCSREILPEGCTCREPYPEFCCTPDDPCKEGIHHEILCRFHPRYPW